MLRQIHNHRVQGGKDHMQENITTQDENTRPESQANQELAQQPADGDTSLSPDEAPRWGISAWGISAWGLPEASTNAL